MQIPVKPEVLRWARETSGYSRAAIDAKLGDATLVDKLESGRVQPTLGQLDKLAKFYGRPLFVLVSSTIPKEPPPPRDYRRASGSREEISPLLVEQIRSARRIQRLANEIGIQTRLRRDESRDLSLDRARSLARRVREEQLRVSVAEQEQRSEGSAPWSLWRSAVEDRGVVVLQRTLRETGVRGFSLTDQGPAVIVVNRSEAAYTGRVFTLFHEYAHVLLRNGGLCFPDEHRGSGGGISLESFCDEFAGQVLVPREALDRLPLQEVLPDGEVNESALARASGSIGVSRQVLLRRLFSEGFVSWTAYEATWSIWASRPTPPPKTGGGGESRWLRALREDGRLVVESILAAERDGSLETSDALAAMGVHLTDLSKLHEQLEV